MKEKLVLKKICPLNVIMLHDNFDILFRNINEIKELKREEGIHDDE